MNTSFVRAIILYIFMWHCSKIRPEFVGVGIILMQYDVRELALNQTICYPLQPAQPSVSVLHPRLPGLSPSVHQVCILSQTFLTLTMYVHVPAASALYIPIISFRPSNLTSQRR